MVAVRLLGVSLGFFVLFCFVFVEASNQIDDHFKTFAAHCGFESRATFSSN